VVLYHLVAHSLFLSLFSSVSLFFYFFFLIFRPLPLSTLFPYTTLFRSNSSFCAAPSMVLATSLARPSLRCCKDSASSARPYGPRSEEHTSELQSPDHLVCRLLLEKKKKKK